MPVITPSSGGGSAIVTAKIRLAATAAGQSTAAQILFDTSVYDLAGYFDSPNHQLVVPAGKAGRHLFVLYLGLQNVPAAANPVVGQLTWSGAETNAAQMIPRRAASSSAQGSVVSVVNAAVGDAMTALAVWDGGGTLDYGGGVAGSYMTVTYLGTG